MFPVPGFVRVGEPDFWKGPSSKALFIHSLLLRYLANVAGRPRPRPAPERLHPDLNQHASLIHRSAVHHQANRNHDDDPREYQRERVTHYFKTIRQDEILERRD